MAVLEVTNLCKNYGKKPIIKNISFKMEEGEVLGFLGPNGAGKTTTIKMITGLVPADSGSIKICGYDIKKNFIEAFKNLGAVVESPELYGYLKGRENLMQIARVRKVPKAQVEKIIKLVGLENRIDDYVKKYSLGMKQRLGLGAALISKPKVLILDEPTNGLDPSGIRDIREIIKNLVKKYKISVFISSHMLAEVEKICDRVIYINEGEIKSVEVINNKLQNETWENFVFTEVNIKEKNLLEKLDYVKEIKLKKDKLYISIYKEKYQDFIKYLVNNNISFKEIHKRNSDLEERYMELVEGEDEDV